MSLLQSAWDVTRRLPRVGPLDLPGVGAHLVSVALARRAPYFRSVQPRLVSVRPHRVELVVPNRRSVRNHIGTVHVIAVVNGLEAAMGALAEVTVPQDRRWIPVGMEMRYPAKADTDITCVAETDAVDWASDGDVPVRVSARRADGVVVVEGVIFIRVGPRPTR